MKVQLSEASKTEFVELIAKDAIKCWFDGDDFVMPSGQGKTAKGIVLGKLMVWQHQQSKVDQLKGQLIKFGFTDNGGQLMKPPLGNAPRFDLLDELRSSIEILVQKYKHDAHASNLFGDQDKARIYNRFANQLEDLLKGGA
ncbi:hypothetical protein [Acinetobacter pittii]|uniref:hypothetical protein n=1 Tax=Acinetobacter pittii TaxID=48296 RepID=UPI0021CD9696|nr:hypothetical protein [Acinetobacter pittii]